MEIEDLITEMQNVKTNHNTLTISEILTMFNIKSLQELTLQLKRMVSK
jgi:hypothetical protein